jgi:transposase InsO family protein
MTRIEPAKRPHYAPAERLEILLLATARGWPLAETARRFLVTAHTIAHWKRRCDEQGTDALLQTREPVNKFPDFVSALVQHCSALVPVAGRRKLAEYLACAGLHLSAATVKRRLDAEACRNPPPRTSNIPKGDSIATVRDVADVKTEATTKAKPPRRIIADYPGHVWGADFTLLPLLGGFAVPWWPFLWPQCWPGCWWVLLVVDHFSRCAVHVAVFASQPSEDQLLAELEGAVRATGPPKHFVTDRGAQFQGAYRDFCKRHGIRPRYGALGQYGSVAVIERLNRTLKHGRLGERLLPLAKSAMLQELQLWQRWYNECRPHARLHGATPAEVRDCRLPEAGGERFETRAWWPKGALVGAPRGVKLELEVSFLQGRKHLPVIRLKQAA